MNGGMEKESFKWTLKCYEGYQQKRGEATYWIAEVAAIYFVESLAEFKMEEDLASVPLLKEQLPTMGNLVQSFGH